MKKLTKEQIKEIVDKRKQGVAVKVLAEEYSVSQGRISQLTGKKRKLTEEVSAIAN